MTTNEFLNDPEFRMWLWERAVPMSQAAVDFAPPALKAELAKLNSKSALKAFSANLEASLVSDHSTEKRILSALDDAQKITDPRKQAHAKLNSSLTNYVKNGELLILGFPEPRKFDDSPVIITPEYWLARREKDGHKIISQSLTFLEVRLISMRHAKNAAEQKMRSIAQAIDVAPVGRPSFKLIILDAFDALQASGAIDPNGQKLAIYRAIRSWIHETHVDLADKPNAPNDETIRRVITPLIDAAKKL